MATQLFSRVFPKTLPSFFSRSLSTTSATPSSSSALSFLRRLSVADITSRRVLLPASYRSLSTQATTSSLRDPNPNWSNRPPKETILLDGCDFEHWLVVMENPEGDPTRDEIIDSYIKTLAQVFGGSEDEARMKIYSVSTRCYFAFGALVSEEMSYRIKELPKVRWVLPDSYLNVREKDYGGEPFINGQAVPYDSKYHDEWHRNYIKGKERNDRTKGPRNVGRRNFDRRENVVNTDMQTRPPMPNPGAPPSNAGGYARPPPGNQGGYAPPAGGYAGPAPGNQGGYATSPPGNQGGYATSPPGNQGGYAPNVGGGYPPPNMGRAPPPPNMGGGPPNSGYGPMGGMPQNNYPGNMGGVLPNQNMGGIPPNAGWSNNK